MNAPFSLYAPYALTKCFSEIPCEKLSVLSLFMSYPPLIITSLQTACHEVLSAEFLTAILLEFPVSVI